MKAAIMALKDLSKGNRCIFVSGDMLELGEHSKLLHKEIGSEVALAGISLLYSTGEFADSVAEGALEQNMPLMKIMVGTLNEICQDLKSKLKPDDWILVKGSRTAGMERVVKQLKEWGDKANVNSS